jgi:uncharacterized repeat protein (TIGR03803 family)
MFCILGMAPLVQPQTFGTLYSFTGGSDGGLPDGALVRDGKGNLYGVTAYGGSVYGTVFEISSAGTESVLYGFRGTSGYDPYGGVARDSQGNLYGVTEGGSSVFEITSAGTEKTIYTFSGSGDGWYPHGSLVRDSEGNLYGTTLYGGAYGYGTVFEISSAGKELMLYSFAAGADGANPFAGVVRDSAGNLYGTTQLGGASNFGTVFKITAAGKESVLYSFAGGSDGQYPCGGLVRDSQGNLYGTTETGGASGFGTVFKVAPGNQETLLYSFTGGTDGANPFAGVVRDTAGNLYGTAANGGAFAFGTVFELTTALTETTLYSFRGTSDGANPAAALVRDAQGNLYGTTESGGTSNFGVVFKVTP